MAKYLFSILFALALASCMPVVDNRTEEQRSADRTRVAEAVPPLGRVRIELLPQGTPTEESLVPTTTPEPTDAPCLDIKGNISASGEFIYHLPGQSNYNQVEIDKEGESYFCTEEEAEAAGFRKARN
jgi:hypothetical protein